MSTWMNPRWLGLLGFYSPSRSKGVDGSIDGWMDTVESFNLASCVYLINHLNLFVYLYFTLSFPFDMSLNLSLTTERDFSVIGKQH